MQFFLKKEPAFIMKTLFLYTVKVSLLVATLYNAKTEKADHLHIIANFTGVACPFPGITILIANSSFTWNKKKKKYWNLFFNNCKQKLQIAIDLLLSITFFRVR